jgi:hypothetical protein
MQKAALLLMLASAAYGQELTRTFHFKNITDPKGMQEFVTTLHYVFQVDQISVDNSTATLTMTGNADQVALAEWLVPKLDVPSGASAAPQKYSYGGNTNDLVEIFGLKNVQNVVGLQEILTTLRTVADIQKIYQVSAPKILVLRTDPSHLALAEFVIAGVDQLPTARKSPSLASFQMTGVRDDSVIVYGLANVSRTFDLQEILTNLRTVLRIQKIYQQSAARYLVIRGSADQIQMAEWLIPRLDTTVPLAGTNRMQIPGGQDDVVGVIYLAPDADLGDIMKSFRNTTKILNYYQRSSPKALVVRSTADQVAMASNLYMNR